MTQNVAMSFSPLDPQFEARVRASFARQRAMETIGATLGRVEPGVVEVALTYRADLTQQQGDRFVATGHVVRAGQTITVCSGIWSHMVNQANGWLRRCWPPCSPRPSVTD